MKVLHVCESFGGGVTSAINTYVKHSPHIEHYLLATTRDNDLTGEESKGEFKEILLLSRRLSSFFKLKKEFDRINPDYVHLHSSFAGFFVRLMFFIPKSKIIYTPHGFSFCRDDNLFLKYSYIFVEFLLKYRTNIIAGCSKNEVNLSINVLKMKNTHEIINICDPILLTHKKPYLNSAIPIIGMVGRISNQKGYLFFSEIAKHFKNKALFVWIGGGDQEKETTLKESSVMITGWNERDIVLQYVNSLDLYFHTAKWEGFPISLLEAVKLEKPVLLREIGPFVDEGLFCVNDISEAISFIDCFISSNANAFRVATETSNEIMNYHTELNIIESLKVLYK